MEHRRSLTKSGGGRVTGVLNMFQDLTGFMLCIVTYKIDNAKVRSVRRNIDTRNLFSKKNWSFTICGDVSGSDNTEAQGKK